MYRLVLYEQQVKNLQEQIQSIEKRIIELRNLNSNLDELKNSSQKEIFAHIGMGIFVKSKVMEDTLTIDIGDGNFVKKDVRETKNILNEQIKRLKKMRINLKKSIDNIDEELNNFLREIEEINK